MIDRGSIWYVHPYAGGPGVGRYDRAFHLSRQFAARGFRPVVICPSFHHLMDAPQRAGTRMIDGIRHEFLRCPAYAGNGVGRVLNMLIFTIQLWLHARRLAAEVSPPVMVIASSPHPYAYLAARRIASRFKAFCVFEVRDLWPLSLIELAGTNPGHPFVRMTARIERHAYATADAVVSLLPCTRDYMEDLGLPPSRWHYVPNGVAPDTGAGDAAHTPCLTQVRKWKAEGCTVIVYAGAFGKPNHVLSLPEAMLALPEGTADVRAVMVGRGEMQAKLQRLAADPRLAGRLLVSDQIPKAAVWSLLALADIGYLSLRPEPLFRFGISPNKLFDYMQAGLPVIAAVRAGNDPVSEAGCGRQIDPEDIGAIAAALRWIADLDPEERRTMGERGRQHVLAAHAYGQLADDYLNLAGLQP